MQIQKSFKVAKIATLVVATLLSYNAQADVSSTGAFNQFSTEAVTKLKASSIDVNALMNNSSNDLIVELAKDNYPLVTTADKQGLAVDTYKNVRLAVLNTLKNTTVLREYYGSPTVFVRVQSRDDLVKLLNSKDVVAVRANTRMSATLAESLPFIRQPQTAATQFRPKTDSVTSKFNGEGSVVAVLDTGLDYRRSAFGNCSSGFNTSACRVAASLELSEDEDGYTDGEADDGSFHGTNVSGVVAGVAPNAKIIALDVFSWHRGRDGKMGHTAPDDALVAAYNWMQNNHISRNAKGYNIVAANMSLGGNGPIQYETNEFPLITTLKNMGVATVVASGNEEMTNGIAWPASERNAIAVGAVYENNYSGSLNCASNPDRTILADHLTCFTNSGRLLDLLAPGFQITAAGITMSGTSQATPHVAGAIAVLRAPAVMRATNNENVDATVARLVNTGKQVTDTRNGIVRPRINLEAAVLPIAKANPVTSTTVTNSTTTPTTPTKPRTGSIYYDYMKGAI